jgi:hypothetical protein
MLQPSSAEKVGGANACLQVEQDRWDFILREDVVRKVMGGYRNGELLPRS